MRYTGSTCAKCGESFHEHDQVVVCPRCGTPEHKNCWAETNSCANEEKHDEGYVWQKEGTIPPPEGEKNSGESTGGFQQAPFNNQGRAADQACPNCGTINDSTEPVCINCGQRIYLDPAANPNAYNPQSRSPFGEKGYHYGYNQTNMEIDGIPATEVAAYVQQNADVYLTKFLYMDNRGTKNSFNWVAGFFPYIWLFYRKMYKAGILVMAALLLIGVSTFSRVGIENNKASIDIMRAAINNEISYEQALQAIDNLPTVKVSTLDYISFGLSAALRVFLALRADSIYRKKVVSDILKSREEAHDSNTYFRLLTQKGGGFGGAAVGAFFLFLFAQMGIEALAMFLAS